MEDKKEKILLIAKTKNFKCQFKFKSFSIQSFSMHPVQIRLTRELIEKIDKLIENGMYPNRSEAVRDAVRRLRLMG